MFAFLKPKTAAKKVPAEKIMSTYKQLRFRTLLGIILGYACFYIVRNNFALSTPHLKAELEISAASVGLLSSYMLIAYGLSKGYMSSLADKADPKRFMALGLVLCALINVHTLSARSVEPEICFAFTDGLKLIY